MERAKHADAVEEEKGPLSSLRIIDLGTRIGAPFAATLLADFGADVIKVELPGGGDFMRAIGPFAGDYSLFWAVEGRGKRSITLDLRQARGQELLRRLAAHADVVVENFRPGTLESWGLGYDELAAVNPGIILARVSVYGQTGPYRRRPGLDRNGTALGGLMYITGYPDRPPVRPGVVISDYLTGVFNAFAIMIALYERDACQGGAGQWIDLSLYESVLRVMEHTVAAYDRLGVIREREGNRLRNSAPLDNWETKDGRYVCIVAAGDGLFVRLARALGRDDLPEEPHYRTLALRAEHAEEINGIVADWCRRHTAREIEEILTAAEVPFSLIYDVREIVEDPHVQARGSIVTVDDPVIGEVRMQGVYPALSRTPGTIQRGAPRLGEHNDEVYGALLGLTEQKMAELRDARVI